MRVQQTITDRMMPFITKDKRIKIAFGGRGGTKSQTFADIFIKKVFDSNVKVGCFREYQNTLDDSVHALIASEIQRLGVPGYKITDKYIKHEGTNGSFKFRGLARNIYNVKSFQGFKYFWVEEGQFLSEQSLQVLIPTLREKDSELWISMNPVNETDAVFKRYLKPNWKQLLKYKYYEDDDLLIVWTNYDENPWFPKELEGDRKRDYELLNRNEYNHIWLGYPNPTVEDAIIKPEWVDACIDAHLKLGFFPRGLKSVIHDPSDEGLDAKGLVTIWGRVVTQAEEKLFGDVNKGMDWALDIAIEQQADRFVWDGGGMGEGLKRQVSDALTGKRIDFQIFHGQESPYMGNQEYTPVGLNKKKETTSKKRTHKQTWKNQRAQGYGLLRDDIFRTYLAITKGHYIDPDYLISISSACTDIDVLTEELCKIPRKWNASGLFQIKDKKEMKALNIPSPNLTDPLMMSYLPYVPVEVDTEPLEFTSFY